MNTRKTFNETSVKSIRCFCDDIINLDQTELDNHALLLDLNKAIDALKVLPTSMYCDEKTNALLNVITVISFHSLTDNVIETIAKSDLYPTLVNLLSYEVKQTLPNFNNLSLVFLALSNMTYWSKSIMETENIKYNLFDTVLSIFKAYNFTSEEYLKNDQLFGFYNILTGFLLNNSYKTEEAINNLIDIGTTDVLVSHLAQLNALKDTISCKNQIKYIKIKIFMILANLLNENDINSLIGISDIIETIVEKIKESMQNGLKNEEQVDNLKHHTSYTINNISYITTAYEWFNRLIRVSSMSDEVKEIVYNLNVFPILEYFLYSQNKGEIKKTCELMCFLCFHNKFKIDLKTNEKLFDCIKSILKDTNDEQTKNYNQQIVFMTDEFLVQQPSSGMQNNILTDNRHIMISYHNKYRLQCLEINYELKKRGFKTWIDENMSEPCDSRRRAVEDASFVLICYSKEYKESSMCRYEAEYAGKLNRKVIAIRMQEKYAFDGWLNSIVSSKLHFDYMISPVNEDNLMFKQIVAILNKKDSVQSQLSTSFHNKTTNIFNLNNPKMWNDQQVKMWLIENELDSLANVFKKYNGITLNSLWYMQKINYDRFICTIDKAIEKSKADIEDHVKLNFYILINDLFNEKY